MTQSGAALKLPQREPEEPGQMSFLEHLEELRKRLIYSCLGLMVAAVISIAFVPAVFDFIFTPINTLLPQGRHFIYTRPGETFSIYIQVTFITAVIVAAPWIMLQAWLFIAPGLYQREKRLAIPFVLLTSAGFVGGGLFNHYVAFPALMKFFGSFDTATVVFLPSIGPVFDLYLRMLIGMGLVFQMPTVAFFLAKMGVVTAGWLIRHMKYAILVMFVVAAVVTPSGDPSNQAVLAGAMLGLYVICIGIVAVFGRKKDTAGAAAFILCASTSLWPRTASVVPFKRPSQQS